MSAMRRRAVVHSARAEERREREDAAPRLCDEVEGLRSLRITIRDLPVAGQEQALKYVRPIVVATAPAYFAVPCMNSLCDGSHDLTDAIMEALKASKKTFEGQSACDGSAEGVPCERTLAYACEAAYLRASKAGR